MAARDAGDFLGANNPPSSADTTYLSRAPNMIGPLIPNTPHWWRINTDFAGSGWNPSPWASFNTINCGYSLNPPTIMSAFTIFTWEPATVSAVNIIFWQGNCDLLNLPIGSIILNIGETTTSWLAPSSGTFCAQMYVFLTVASNPVTFTIPSYTLNPPAVIGLNVNFSWTPPVTGNFLNLVIWPDVCTDLVSEAVANLPLAVGQNTLAWTAPTAGSYCARLQSWTTPLSNEVNFSILYRLVDPPNILGLQITFNWSPALASTALLVLYQNACTGTSLPSSPTLATGSSTITWDAPRAGDFCARLEEPSGNIISNEVKFYAGYKLSVEVSGALATFKWDPPNLTPLSLLIWSNTCTDDINESIAHILIENLNQTTAKWVAPHPGTYCARLHILGIPVSGPVVVGI